jgi:primase-polymerase (primpol)-like protein
MTIPNSNITASVYSLDQQAEQNLAIGPRNLGEKERPRALKVSVELVPDQLRVGRRYVVWRYDGRLGNANGAGKWTKPPLNAKTLLPASVTNPDDWATFEEAVSASRQAENSLDGIGLVLYRDAAPGNTLVAWDLDRCRDALTGSLEAWASDLVGELDTYAEVSPSGYGVRLFCYGQLPSRGRKKGPVECYDTARYVTITGQRLEGTPTTVKAPGAKLQEIHARYWPAPVPPSSPARVAK